MSRLPDRCWLSLLVATLFCCSHTTSRAEQPDGEPGSGTALLDQLDKATGRAAGDSYLLRYRFSQDEPMRTRVVQLVSMQTRIDGNDQTVQSRSESLRQWDVKRVDSAGNITFEHSIREVKMWQKVSGKDEIRFDSNKDKDPPGTYQAIAESLGKPLSTVTISSRGKVIERVDRTQQFNPGIDSLVIPLPEKAVKVGQKWHTPQTLRIRTADGLFKSIQLRRQYALEKVEKGIATISIKTQVLTPLNDPKIQSQLVQRLQDGTLRFDIQRGQVQSKKMNLDQRVIGFNGPSSMMHYLARMTEETLSESRR